jgi:subtilisin family serine protease
LANVATTVGSRLPEIISNASSRGASESDRTMSRLGGPEQPASDEKSSGDERTTAKPKAQRKDDDPDDDGGSATKPAGRNLGRRVAGSLLPPPGTFKPNEVLAVDLDAAKLARALKRNFKVIEKIEYPALGFNLTRLATPDTQNAIIGRTTLHEELPSDGFGLNHIYAAGRVTTAVPSGTDPGGGGKAPPVPSIPSPGFNGDRRAGACAPDRCFGLSVINWQPQLAACARGVKIGIIDTGVDKSHPAFAGVHFQHETFIPRNAKKPPNHHGTGVFSLLAGNPRSSTPGLVPEATFLVGDAFFADPNGNAMSDTVTMLKALNWLKAAGVDVANLSFAGPRDELVEDAINKLAKTGTVILAAAGNEGQDAPPSYPAAYKEVIAVTAVDRNLSPYAYANRGSHIDVAAPGVDVWTALPNRREGRQTGTSFAVPFVTSVVALSYRREARSAHADPLAPKRQALAQLQRDIKTIGGRGQSSIFGAGIVQAPSHCDPHGPAIVAKTDGWNGVVQTAPPANPPTNLQAGSWTSTVLPVARAASSK